MNRNQQQNNTVQNAAVAAVAAASNTPFKTAFKITLGIALAQLAVLGMFLVGGAVVIGTIVALVK